MKATIYSKDWQTFNKVKEILIKLKEDEGLPFSFFSKKQERNKDGSKAVYPYRIYIDTYRVFENDVKNYIKDKIRQAMLLNEVKIKKFTGNTEIDNESFDESISLLRDYQKSLAREVLENLEKSGASLLLADVGVGKTFIALAVMRYYLTKNFNFKILYLAPKSFVRGEGKNKVATALGIKPEEILEIDKTKPRELIELVKNIKDRRVIIIPYSNIKAWKEETDEETLREIYIILEEELQDQEFKSFLKRTLKKEDFKEVSKIKRKIKKEFLSENKKDLGKEIDRVVYETIINKIVDPNFEPKTALEKSIVEELKSIFSRLVIKLLLPLAISKVLYNNNVKYFIIDEVHYIKNKSSKTHKLIHNLLYYYRAFKRDFNNLKVVGLTATPFPNGDIEEIQSYADLIFYKPLKLKGKYIQEKMENLTKDYISRIEAIQKEMESEVEKIIFSSTIDKALRRLKNSFFGYYLISEYSTIFFPTLEERKINLRESQIFVKGAINSAEVVIKLKEFIWNQIEEQSIKLNKEKLQDKKIRKSIGESFKEKIIEELTHLILENTDTSFLKQIKFYEKLIKEIVREAVESKPNFIRELLKYIDKIIETDDLQEKENLKENFARTYGLFVYTMSQILVRLENGFIVKDEKELEKLTEKLKINPDDIRKIESKWFIENKGHQILSLIKYYQRENKKILIFLPFIKQRELLYKLLKENKIESIFLAHNSDDLESIYEMEELPKVLILGYFAKEGIDLKDYEVAIFGGIPNDISYLSMYQARGRILRTFGEEKEKEVVEVVTEENKTIEYFFYKTHIKVKKEIQNIMKEVITDAKKILRGGVLWEL